MHVLDYESIKDLLIEAMEDADLLVKMDEVLFMGDMAKACELFIRRPLDDERTWAKVGFDWRAENQATTAYAAEFADTPIIDSPYEIDNPVLLHAAFHLHFNDLDISTDIVHEVGVVIQNHALRLFGAEGAVVAEVRLLPLTARLECLRFELTVESPAHADENWWREWGPKCAEMLTHFDELHAELYTRFGPLS